MKSIVAKANKSMSIPLAAALISASFFVSALLGLLRERLLIAQFGIGGTLDSYYAAFSVPDFLYFLLVSGALSVSFIPVLNERLEKGNKDSAWDVSSSLLNLLGLVTLGASIFIIIFADPLVSLLFSDFDPARHEQTVSLMRIFAVNPFAFGLSSVLASMQQAIGRFFFNALAPVIYNLGIIGGIIFLSPSLGIKGVAIGVAIGSVVQLAVQFIGMIGMGYSYTSTINWKNKGFKQVIKLLIPRSIDQGGDQLVSVIQRSVAAAFAIGSITAFQSAYTLIRVPVTLIGVAISTAVFPKLSRRAATTRSDLFKKDFLQAVHVILWLSLPAAAIAFIMRGYIVRLLVGDGNALISSILGWFVLSIVFLSVFNVVSRSFYAQQDTMTPLKSSLAAITINIIGAIFLSRRYGVEGIAMAFSIASGFEVIVLAYVLHRRLNGVFTKAFVYSSVKMIIATVGMGVVARLCVRYVLPLKATDVGFFTLTPKFLGIVAISAVVYVGLSGVLRIRGATPIARVLGRMIFKRVPITDK